MKCRNHQRETSTIHVVFLTFTNIYCACTHTCDFKHANQCANTKDWKVSRLLFAIIMRARNRCSSGERSAQISVTTQSHAQRNLHITLPCKQGINTHSLTVFWELMDSCHFFVARGSNIWLLWGSTNKKQCTSTKLQLMQLLPISFEYKLSINLMQVVKRSQFLT